MGILLSDFRYLSSSLLPPPPEESQPHWCGLFWSVHTCGVHNLRLFVLTRGVGNLVFYLLPWGTDAELTTLRLTEPVKKKTKVSCCLLGNVCMGTSNRYHSHIREPGRNTCSCALKWWFFFCIASNFNFIRLWHFSYMPGYFGVSVIHWTLTWATGSLACICNLFCMRTSTGT